LVLLGDIIYTFLTLVVIFIGPLLIAEKERFSQPRNIKISYLYKIRLHAFIYLLFSIGLCFTFEHLLSDPLKELTGIRRGFPSHQWALIGPNVLMFIFTLVMATRKYTYSKLVKRLYKDENNLK